MGFYSMPTKKVAKPDLALLEFLAMGEPPVYIGWVDNPNPRADPSASVPLSSRTPTR